MNKKILWVFLIMLIGIITPAYGFDFVLPNELKAGAVYLVKISIGVVISSFVIGIGLWIYSRFNNAKQQKSLNSNVNQFRCEIDDT